MSGPVRIGTRGSPLALWQADHVRDLLRERHPDRQYETVIIDTTGDRVLDTPLPAIGGKGVFTAELEESLRDRSIDIAVHSLKDLPTADSPGLALGAVVERGPSGDALVSRGGHTLATLPHGAAVGTSSSRRAAQLLAARPDLRMVDLRGNAGTRLRKAMAPDGPYDAIVIAVAAMERLGRAAEIAEVIGEGAMLPAPGQGAIGVQCRDEAEGFALVRSIDHEPTRLETTAERALLEGLGGGCAVPVAARAHVDANGHLVLQGRVVSTDGTVQIAGEKATHAPLDGSGRQAALECGFALARDLLGQGAAALLSDAPGA